MTVISMETAQQQAASLKPIRICCVSVSRPIGEAVEGEYRGFVGRQGEGSGGVIEVDHFLLERSKNLNILV